LLFAILYVVFVKFLKLGNGIPHYPVYLLFGIVMWNFFVEMTMQSLGAIVGRGDLIRKIRIPRWLIILSTSINAIINLLLNMLVITVFMIVGHVNISSTIIWLPFIFIEVYLFAFGLSLFLSAVFVKYRDVNYVWEVLLQAGFYVTPILYPLSRITDVTIQKLILLSPMAQAVQDARYSLITHATITPYSLYQNSWLSFVPFVTVLATLVIGIAYFKSQANYFAENI
jgi:ABC-2 type transport system permease protein